MYYIIMHVTIKVYYYGFVKKLNQPKPWSTFCDKFVLLYITKYKHDNKKFQ